MNRGWLKNGNPGGDLTKAARCEAKTRRGVPCQCPAMSNGRCRLHGGKSTGPKTAEGIERIRRAVTKHGRYSKAARAEQEHNRNLLRNCREVMEGISGRD
jgi:hypothetical protein